MREGRDVSWVGDLQPRFADVGRIAVLRGSGLGDLVQVLPAVAALAAAYPRAELTLIGTSAHVALLDGRPSPFTALTVLPAGSGVWGGGPPDPAATDAFVARVRDQQLDLAVQVDGVGGPAADRVPGAQPEQERVGGAATAVQLERSRPFVYYQHEGVRALEVVALAGATPVGLEPRLPLLPEEQERRARRGAGRPVVVLHPGATDPRRRWPPTSFSAVVTALVADGARAVLVGDAEDVGAAEEVLEAVPDPLGLVTSVVGTQTLAELVTTLLDADVVLANDSGPRHVAAALGVPTVGVYWIGNVVNAGPLSRSRHRLQIGFATACPVCGADITQVGWTAERCEHDGSIVADVPPGRVLADVRDLLAEARSSGAGGPGPAGPARGGGRDAALG